MVSVASAAETVGASLDACVMLAYGRYGSHARNLATQWAMGLLGKFTRIAACRGLAWAIPDLKSYFARCRMNSLVARGSVSWKGVSYLRPPSPVVLRYHSWRRLVFQVSRCGRALPTPSQKVVLQALESHAERVTTGFATNPEILARLSTFVEGLCRPCKGVPMSPSVSASVGRSRRLGGALEDLRGLSDGLRSRTVTELSSVELAAQMPREIFGPYIPFDLSKAFFPPGRVPRVDEVFFLYSPEYEIGLDAWEVIREDLFLLAACWLSINWETNPVCRQVAVAERGWKVRVVTPIEPSLSYLGSPINSLLLDLLRKVPHTRGGLVGKAADHLDWGVGNFRGGWVRSLDLKEASDRLPHDLVAAMVQGLVRGFGLAGTAWERVLKRLTGPFDLALKSTGRTVTTCRALLMGAPVTWPLLSLYVLWCHHETSEGRWGAVCGDDYVGCCTPRTSARMTRLLEQTGALISPGKDALCRGPYGVFAEELISVGRRRVLRTSSVRPWVFLGAEDPLWSLGPRLACELVRDSDLVGPARQFIATRLDITLNRVRRCGIDPFMPRWCGGAGFPGLPSQSSLRLLRGLAAQPRKDFLDWAARFSACWVQQSSGAVEYALELLRPLIAEYTWPVDWPEGLPVSELVGSFCGHVGSGWSLAFGAAQRRDTNLRSIGLRIRGILAKARNVTWWVPHETVHSPDVLLSKLLVLEPRISREVLRDFRFRVIYHFLPVGVVGEVPSSDADDGAGELL